MSSGIAPLEADFKGPNTTAEGDFVVLLLQTARFLQKQLAAARRGEPLSGLTSILVVAADPEFKLADARPSPPRTTAEVLTLVLPWYHPSTNLSTTLAPP